MTTPLDLDALERMEREATQAPWCRITRRDGTVHKALGVWWNADIHVGAEPTYGNCMGSFSLGGPGAGSNAREDAEANADLAVALRNAAPALFALARSAESWKRRAEEADKTAVQLFTSGYWRGHHDTVEGGYVDVRPSDADTYFKDDVDAILADARAALRPPGDAENKDGQ